MSSNCRIVKNNKGGVESVTAPNGEKSKLFADILKVTGGNENAALNLYALSETADFKTVQNAKAAKQRVSFFAGIREAFKSDKNKQATQFVSEYLRDKLNMDVNILSEESMLEELNKLGYSTLEDAPTKIGASDKVYGFYEKTSNKVFLTEEYLNSGALIHESWHMWKPVLTKRANMGNKDARILLNSLQDILTKAGFSKESLKERFDSKKVSEDDRLASSLYNPKPGETFEQYSDRMQEEAEANLLGDNSIAYFKRIAEENGLDKEETKSFIDSIRDFILQFSDWLSKQLGFTEITENEAQDLTAKDILDRITTSMLRGDFGTFDALGSPLKSDYTLPMLKLPSFKQLEGKQAKRISVTSLLNQGSVKQIEKDLANFVLDSYFEGQDIIDYNRFKSILEATIMPLELISIQKYAEYGSDSVEMSYGYDHETIILNSPVAHGIEGAHFSAREYNGAEVGMFGHGRVWVGDSSIYTLAEMQSDFFQKYKAKDAIVEPLHTAEEIAEFAERKWNEIVGYFKGTYKTERLSEEAYKISQDLGIESPIKIIFDNSSTVVDSNEFQDIENLSSIEIKHLVDSNSKLSQNSEFIIAKHKEMEAFRKATKPLAGIQGEQFISLQKNHEVRILREFIKDAANRGFDRMRIPTAYTISNIEGFIGQYDSSNPWDDRPDSVVEGEIHTIYGDEYTILNVGYEIEVAPANEVTFYSNYEVRDIFESRAIEDIDDLIYDNSDELSIEDLENLIEEEYGERRTFLERVLNEVSDSDSEEVLIILDEYEHIKDSVVRDIYYSRGDIEDMLGGEESYEMNNGYYIIEKRDSIRYFNEPSDYTIDMSESEFSIDGLDNDDQKTVARKYEALEKTLRKERGANNVEIITDENGFTWYEFPITEEDRQEKIVSFSVGTSIRNTEIQKTGPNSTKMSVGATEVYFKERENPFTGKKTGQIELELIKTAKEARGNGEAKRALKQLLRYTDGLKKDVYLMVSPRENGITTEGLENLYAANGFYKISDFEMLRKAKPFKTKESDSNGEAPLKDVIDFSRITEEPLTKEEEAVVRNAAMAMGVNSLSELRDALNKTFVKDGIVSFSKVAMQRSGYYNSYEISAILNSFTAQTQIEDLIHKIGNAKDFDIEYNPNFIVPSSTSINTLGKQDILNPNMVMNDLLESVAGLSEDDILLNLEEDFQQRYSEDESFRDMLKNAAATTKVVPVMEVFDGQLVDKTNDTLETLLVTMSEESNPALLEDIDFLTRGLDSGVWEENKSAVSKVLEGIKNKAIVNGIDLSGLASKALTKSREDLVSFLEALENVILEPSIESMDIFASAYNDMFDLTSPQTEVIATDSKFDVIVKGEVSEYEMFRDHGLVKKEGEVYRKVAPQVLEELYDAFFENKNLLPDGIESVEELKQHVQQNLSELEISDFGVDTELLERIYLYKSFFGFRLSEKPAEISTGALTELTRDFTYLTEDFVREFNKFVLSTKNAYFKVTSKGIELIHKDSISKMEAIESVPEELREDLAQYNAISKHLGLDLEHTEDDYNRFDSLKDARLAAINNPKSVSKIQGSYTNLEDGVIAVKDEANTFVRTPLGVYEMIFEMGNVKFFNKLPNPNANYKVLDASKPLSDIDFSKYRYLETSPEVFKEAKNYYSNSELKEINKQYFDCK